MSGGCNVCRRGDRFSGILEVNEAWEGGGGYLLPERHWGPLRRRRERPAVVFQMEVDGTANGRNETVKLSFALSHGLRSSVEFVSTAQRSPAN